MTEGWQIIDGEDHYFTGARGECGRLLSLCKEVETMAQNFTDVPQGAYCRHCKQIKKLLAENVLMQQNATQEQ